MVGRAVPLIVLPLLAAALVGMPTATAQAPVQPHFTVTVEASAAPIVPGTGSGLVRATFTLDCQTALRSNGGGPAVIVVVASVAEPNVPVNGPGTVLLSSSACMSGAPTASVVAQYNVTASRLAPGLQPLKGEINATLQRGGPAESEAHAQAPFVVTVDYFPYIQAKLRQSDVAVAPGKAAAFEVDVSNFGNAQTQVTFALAAEAPSGWQVTLPPALTLDSPNNGGAKSNGTVTVTVVGSGDGPWTNKELPIELVLTPVAALDASKAGHPISVSFWARSQGTPGPEVAPLLITVVLSAALAARRRA